MHRLLVAALLVSAVSAANNVCPKGSVVHMPTTIPQYYWPASWNENMTAPHLAANQECSWTVTIPSGYYAKIIIDGKVADKDSRFQMIDSAGNIVESTHETKLPYYFPPVKFTLIVSVEAAATFAFKIVWAPIPIHGFNAGVGNIANLFNATTTVFSNEFGSSSALSVLVFPQDIHKHHELRSVFIYEGGRNDAQYSTNMDLVFKTGKQYVSGQTAIMIVNVEASSAFDYYLVQQYDHLKNLHPYKALECNPNTNCTATIDGKKQASALITVPHGNETLVDVEMDATANFTIYYGSPSAFAFYKSYTGAEIKSVLPMYCSYIMTFVISSGKAVFSFVA